MTIQTRPHKSLGGAELIQLILAGDPDALAEGQNHRSVPSVKAAVKAVSAATPVPATKPVDSPKAKARTAAQKRATTLRKKAWDLRIALRDTEKITYAEACRRVGVKPANAAKA